MAAQTSCVNYYSPSITRTGKCGSTPKVMTGCCIILKQAIQTFGAINMTKFFLKLVRIVFQQYCTWRMNEGRRQGTISIMFLPFFLIWGQYSKYFFNSHIHTLLYFFYGESPAWRQSFLCIVFRFKFYKP